MIHGPVPFHGPGAGEHCSVLTLHSLGILYSCNCVSITDEFIVNFLHRCPATGVPAPKLSFYQGDNLLTENDNFAFDYDRGVMTIKKADVGYEGEYYCVAENPAGASRMKTKIELLSKYIRTYQNQLRKEEVFFI